jgi:hypothetical protein
MIEKIDKTLDELKYTQTRIVAIQTDQFAPCAQMAGNANLQLGPYKLICLYGHNSRLRIF